MFIQVEQKAFSIHTGTHRISNQENVNVEAGNESHAMQIVIQGEKNNQGKERN